jgi:excisionase family DNA binding protein
MSKVLKDGSEPGMSKEKALLISVLCLSASIIISAVIIANGMRSQGDSVNAGLAQVGSGIVNSSNSSTSYDTGILNLSTAAEYLGISDVELTDLIYAKDSGIPYVKIGSNFTFSKGALDKWLETARVEVK